MRQRFQYGCFFMFKKERQKEMKRKKERKKRKNKYRKKELRDIF